jgi:tetratricopeptide (TPR) repeat protein
VTRQLSGILALLQMAAALSQNFLRLWRSARPFPRHASISQPPCRDPLPTSLVSSVTGKLREWRERWLLTAAIFHLSFHRSGAANEPAMKYCRRLTREYPEHSTMWLALGQRWLDASAEAFDSSDEPLRCFQNVLQMAPDCVEGWYGLGMTLQHKGNVAEAADAYRTVLDREPSHVAARFRLWCLAKKNPDLTASAISPYREPGAYLRDISLDAAERSTETEVGELRGIQRQGAVLIRNAVPDQTIATIRRLIVPFVERYDTARRSPSRIRHRLPS